MSTPVSNLCQLAGQIQDIFGLTTVEFNRAARKAIESEARSEEFHWYLTPFYALQGVVSIFNPGCGSNLSSTTIKSMADESFRYYMAFKHLNDSCVENEIGDQSFIEMIFRPLNIFLGNV